MDSFEVFANGEWESFSKMFSNEDFDFTNHNEGLHFITPSTFCSTSEDNESLFYSNNLLNLSQDSISFVSNYSTSDFDIIPTSDVTNDVSIYMVDEKISSMEETCPIKQYVNGENQATTALHLKRKSDEDVRVLLNVIDSSETNVKKKPKPRSSRDVQGTKKKKNQNMCSKRNEGEESINGGSDGQSSTSSYNSEDDNASQEKNNGESKASLALNLNGNPRASRGSATDPQSLYARKRREKINERLKILQNLVPNGTKVDISTMLEDAVHYVKFLQLQIKLLSSDDLWMYAPLAYNGIDLCLNQKISSFL